MLERAKNVDGGSKRICAFLFYSTYLGCTYLGCNVEHEAQGLIRTVRASDIESNTSSGTSLFVRPLKNFNVWAQEIVKRYSCSVSIDALLPFVVCCVHLQEARRTLCFLCLAIIILIPSAGEMPQIQCAASTQDTYLPALHSNTT